MENLDKENLSEKIKDLELKVKPFLIVFQEIIFF